MSISNGLTPAERITVESLDANQREFFEERAAIIEEGDHVSRIDAERRALVLTCQWFGLPPPP
ncbi:hypothetical protein WL58_21880 [Burkholderia cepacia]|uniref:hypothetical protein n=1 Tax=Burkholderia cepacia complex TaxID=87882 RepID=UPI00076D078C|nr:MULTISPECIES: hypothetical protein [Burkholderia cepacia complex]KWC78941.1 hypothetical protein WL58_21880 [Burkholderia cepacia]MBY4802856.1 hypothetical protein [Burkholderia cepacia]